jgi:hypothetical protein
MLKPLSFALLTFLLIGVVAGQIIMHGQGDTASISIRYGFLYVVTGCGVPDLLRGHTEYWLPVLCEIVPAVFMFWILRHKRRSQNDA